MSANGKTFFLLWILGLIGVASLLMVPIPSALVEGKSLWFFALQGLSNDLLLVTVGTFLGVWLAPKVGLYSSLHEVFQRRSPFWEHFQTQIYFGVLAGWILGIAMTLIDSTFFTAWSAQIPVEVYESLQEDTVPLLTHILYGGITEELMFRFGAMTLIIWVLWYLLQKKKKDREVSPHIMGFSILAVAFGVGYLRLGMGADTFVLLSPLVIMRAIFLDLITGAAYGLLYWHRGLESAIIAHMCTHATIFLVDYGLAIQQSLYHM